MVWCGFGDVPGCGGVGMSETCSYCEEAEAARERTGLEYVCVVHRQVTA